MEKKTISLPIELPDIEKKEDLEALIKQKEAELDDMKDTLKIFIWCTDFSKLKPTDTSTFNWVGNNIQYLIGTQNQIGEHEVLLYKLKLWRDNWNSTVKIKGFSE